MISGIAIFSDIFTYRTNDNDDATQTEPANRERHLHAVFEQVDETESKTIRYAKRARTVIFIRTLK